MMTFDLIFYFKCFKKCLLRHLSAFRLFYKVRKSGPPAVALWLSRRNAAPLYFKVFEIFQRVQVISITEKLRCIKNMASSNHIVKPENDLLFKSK